MELKNNFYYMILVCFVLFLHARVSDAASSDPLPRKSEVRAKVTAGDCRKCHQDVVQTLQRKGEAHTELCLDCHRGHPPADMEIIPACSDCHQGETHFSLAGCITCHQDPHNPLEIHLTRDITEPCLTCHEEQVEQLREHPSIHTKFQCTACHWYHGQIQPCQNCHLPHSDTMGAESCRTCHRAHMPLVVNYGETIPSEDCGSCHTKIYETMADTWSRHRNVACVTCHAGRHGMIPKCLDCHGEPHPDEIWEKFEKCVDCHAVAHDLWATKASTNKFVLDQ